MKRLSTEDFTQRIGRALALGLTGDMPGAGREIKAVAEHGPSDAYALICALAQAAVALDVQGAEPGDFFGLTAVHHGQPADIDAAPPALRLAMRFMAAQANQDYDASMALFNAAMETEPATLGDAVPILLQAALETAREQIARSKEAGGA